MKKGLTLCLCVFVFFLSSAAQSIQDLRWRLLGPLRAGWSICTEGIPDEPNTYYFGAADGGVWKTIDSGVTWQSLSDHAPFSSVSGIAISRSNPRTIYVGTGQIHTRYDVMDGNGVYKTEDEGKTWISLGLSDTRHIGRLWMDPRNEKVLLVAALGHLFGPNAERGVFRTEDGGSNWRKVLYVNENTGAVDLASDPNTPDIVYAALWQVRQYPWQSYFTRQVGPGSGIWKSTDGGKTWKATSRKGLPEGPLSRIGLAVASSTKGQRVYATVVAEKGTGFYRSDDGGDSWYVTVADAELASTYMNRLTADPVNADIVYVMGRGLRKSIDGGKTFTIIKGAPGGDDYHFYWINPKNPKTSILGTDQGTTISVNGGITWSPWYNQPTGQFYHLAADQRYPYWIYSAQQDCGTVRIASRSDYGQITFRDWHPVGGDERDYDIPDPEDPDIVYGSGLGGRLSKWDARTGKVANISPWPVSSYAARPTTVKYRYTWITPIAISPRAPHALYQGAQVLFRSLNKGASWDIVSPDLTGFDPNAKNCEGDLPIERATPCGYGVIFSIAPSPIQDGLLWMGTDNGRILITRDDAKTWINVTPPAITDWSKIASLDASATDPATAYAAVDRHRLDDRRPFIYRTHDYGKKWTLITKGLPQDVWVNVVRQDTIRAGLLYAGTRTGLFVSLDDGANWQSLQLNFPTTSVNDLLVHQNDLIAATQGRALWVLDNITPLRHVTNAAVSSVNLVPPADAVRVSANENRDTPLPPEMPSTPNPPAGAIMDYFLPEESATPLVLQISDESGNVIRTIRSDDPDPRPKALRYFAERWIRPPKTLSTKQGHNRYVWDLRYNRPTTAEYEYSIAAVPYEDTPIVPQGMLVLPGVYTLRLSAGDQAVEQKLKVVQDPRSRSKPEDLRAQLAFYREVEKTAADLTSRINNAGPAVQEKLKKFAGNLTSLLIDLEGADGPPTDAQRLLYKETNDSVQKLLGL